MDKLELIYIILTTFGLTIKTYHYTTNSYQHHLIVDEFLNKYNKLSDQFIESCMGNSKSLELSNNITIKISKIDNKTIFNTIDLFKSSIDSMKKLYSNYGDLITILDEMLLNTNLMRYKLSIAN